MLFQASSSYLQQILKEQVAMTPKVLSVITRKKTVLYDGK